MKKNRAYYKYFILLAILLLLGGCNKKTSDCVIEDLTVNYRSNPVCIDERPVFSWKIKDKTKGQYQTAYNILVSDSKENLSKKNYIWDSGKILSDISVAVPYTGDELEPEKRYYWKVSVWDKSGNKISSQQEAFFETGIIDNDWSNAEWICVKEKKEDIILSDSYNIQYDFRMDNISNSGFVWGADDGYYGEHMICTIDTTQDFFDLSVCEMNGEDIVKEDRYKLDEFGIEKDTFLGKTHHIQIDINDNNITVILDNIVIVKQQNSKIYNLGKIGFWTARGAFYAYYDNLIITDDLGESVYEEKFEDGNINIFSPYYTKNVEGWIESSSGYILTQGWEKPAPMFRKEFSAQGKIVSAKLYASALGIYEIYINGDKVGDEFFSPGQSVYTKEVYYRTYDITNQIKNGDNAIGVMLGHGRYNRAKTSWGDTLSFLGKIVINYEDGSEQIIVSDSSWKAFTNGPVRNDDMFLGEYYDANFELEGWKNVGFSEENWEMAEVYSDKYIDRKFVSANSEPVRCIQELKPISVSEPEAGVFVYDFGQNINGFCRITASGEKGQVVTLRYAETLNQQNMSCRDDLTGTIWTQNLYTADNTDYYVFKGLESETYTPKFVCRGFRYIQLTGLDNAIPLEDITAMVLSSDLKRSGYFECSNEDINKLYNSIYWTQIDNFVDIPVDCPQRDERFGWAGDAQVFAPTAAYNADIYQCMRQYVTALRLGQNENGAYPEIAPGINMSGGSNGWSDAGIILVWQLYQQYGDKTIIEENMDAMCKYMDYLVDTSENFIRVHTGYSDHNSVSSLDETLCNTAQCAYVAMLLTKMCEIMEEEALVKKYETIAKQYKEAWQKEYINEDGTIDCWLQSAYALGLAFELYPENLQQAGADCLNSAVAYNNYHLNTGFVATPHLLKMLCDYGYADTAYKILMQKDYPSWNNMFAHGATTITEAWNTYYDNEDGTYGINGSLNHYGLGAVGEWFYEYILGIKGNNENPGFKHFYLEPIVGGGLTYAKGSYESVYGTIKSEWKVEGNKILFKFVIPPNTTATLNLPDPQYRNLLLESGEYEYQIVCK